MIKPVVLRGGTGPGSRQPVLKLPSVMPNGRRIKKHPMLYFLQEYIAADPKNRNKSVVATQLGIRPQSLYKWERACEADRNFPLPVKRAQQMADLFKVPPSIFRPDFPWSKP